MSYLDYSRSCVWVMAPLLDRFSLDETSTYVALTDLESRWSLMNFFALQHSASLSARCTLHRVSLILDGFVRARNCSSNAVGENALNQDIF